MDAVNDEQLIHSFRETGEMRQFDELVRRHIGKVRAMVYSMVLNDADADDLTQDIFMRVAGRYCRIFRKICHCER